MLPLSGVSSPAISRNKVDLPQPLRPTMATKVPATISRSMPRSTECAPNDFATLRRVTATPVELVRGSGSAMRSRTVAVMCQAFA